MSKERKYIKIRGANEHNLKNIDLDIPRDEFVVLTGLSGSGKSSLAFDTIYAEGQRRYMESLSSYARQFLGQAEKPNVEKIEGLSPAISIDQKSTNRNPRSTVGTVTEILISCAMTACATFFLAAGVAGYMGKNLSAAERVLFFAAALMFIMPGSMFDLIGIVMGVVLVAWCLIFSRRQNTAAV